MDPYKASLENAVSLFCVLINENIVLLLCNYLGFNAQTALEVDRAWPFFNYFFAFTTALRDVGFWEWKVSHRPLIFLT